MGDINRDGQPPAKKVRVACRRCRIKRVKCDGGIPACGNCARAKAPCIDVDSRNNDQSIPRDYATKCCSRIKWLEQEIRLLDPNFDLEKGPQVEKDILEGSHNQSPRATGNGVPSHALSFNPQASADEDPARLATGKRSYDSLEEPTLEQPLSVEAHSVAMDLGMISLHSDSRQKHYLGSSSGLLFMKLIGVGAAVQPSSPSSFAPTTASSRNIISRHRPREDTYYPLYSNLKKELPSPEDANLLLAVYFQYIHIEHPFLHPTSLINAYNALYACTECRYDSEKLEQNGWLHDIKPFPYNGKLDMLDGNQCTPISISTAIFHVFMVFSLAATVLTRKRNFDHSPIRFYRMAMQSTSDCFSGVSVSALQGVLLLAIQGIIEPAGLNIWTLMNVAMSHCVDLGLHREPDNPSDLSPIARTVRRLIFHAVYSLDRSVSTIQGRPLGIRDETFDVRQPTLEDIASDKSYIVSNSEVDVRPPPVEYMAFPLRRFRLDRYISEIKLLFYHLPSQANSIIWPSNLEKIQQRIKNDIDQWLVDSSTVVPKVDSEESLILHCENLKLESQYHSAVTLLYQPSQVFRSPTQHALSLCYQSSSKRLRIYSYLNNEEQLHYNWRNIHGIFSSGATIVYCLWVSRNLQKTVPFADALRDLLICSNLLSIGGQWWPSVRQGKESFEKVMDLTIKELGRIENRQKSPPSPVIQRQDQDAQPSFDVALDEQMSQGQGSVAQPTQLPSLPEDSTVNPNPMISGVDTSFTGGFGQQPLLSDNQSLDDNGVLPIDPAIESFMADYLHGDWGWDPFSGT